MRIIAGICLLLLGVLLLAYGISLAISPQLFQSTVRITLEREKPEIGRTYDPYWIQTEFEKIQSKAILYPVISNLQLQVKWNSKDNPAPLPIDKAYKQLKSQFEVRQARASSLIEITARSQDPNEAAAIANAIAHEYIQNRMSLKKELIAIHLTKLTNQLNKVQQQVRAFEERLSKPGQNSNDTVKFQRDLNSLKSAAEGIIAEQEFLMRNKEKPEVEIIDRAEPALKLAYPTKLKMGTLFLSGALSVFIGLLLLEPRYDGASG